MTWLDERLMRAHGLPLLSLMVTLMIFTVSLDLKEAQNELPTSTSTCIPDGRDLLGYRNSEYYSGDARA